jgi:hypothetical protein
MTRLSGTALAAVAGLLALQPAFAEPAVDVQTRCFQFSDAPARLLQLRLLETDDGSAAAFVRYRGAKAWIPLVLSRTKRIPMADSGRSQEDTEWVEIVQDQVAGRYALSMFGNEVLSFDYVNRKTGTKTAFAPAPMPRGVDPCEAK